MQEAVFRLGRVPEWHQTDNSCGATHQVSSGGRKFLPEYLELMMHLGMKPRTTAVGQKEQNGTVEAQNGAFKRYLDQRLQARGSREFAAVESFDEWLVESLCRENSRRGVWLQEELAIMKPVPVARLPEYREVSMQVSRNSTINVMHNIYSVPPRLMHKVVRARIYEDEIAVYYGHTHIQTMSRLIGRAHHRINYRHVILGAGTKAGGLCPVSLPRRPLSQLNLPQGLRALTASLAGHQRRCGLLADPALGRLHPGERGADGP